MPLFNDREASSWARSRRILFLQDFIQNILLSPTLNREVLGSSQKSEENNCLPSSLFSVSTFRSSVVSPDWDTNWLCSPGDGKKKSNPPLYLCQQGHGYSTGTQIDNAGSCPVAYRINAENIGMVSFRAVDFSTENMTML